MSGCDALRSNWYVHRHGTLCRAIHHCIVKKYAPGSACKNWWEHKPTGVEEFGGKTVKVVWNQFVNTSRATRCNRPDIIIYEQDAAYVIEISCPSDENVLPRLAEKKKKTKYIELIADVKRKNRHRKVYYHPIVIGATGLIAEESVRAR